MNGLGIHFLGSFWLLLKHGITYAGVIQSFWNYWFVVVWLFKFETLDLFPETLYILKKSKAKFHLQNVNLMMHLLNQLWKEQYLIHFYHNEINRKYFEFLKYFSLNGPRKLLLSTFNATPSAWTIFILRNKTTLIKTSITIFYFFSRISWIKNQLLGKRQPTFAKTDEKNASICGPEARKAKGNRQNQFILLLFSAFYVKRGIKWGSWDREFNAFETTFFDAVASLLLVSLLSPFRSGVRVKGG